DDTGLLAVQGPKAEALLAPLTPLGIAMIPSYHFAEGKVAGVQCFISRTGYTGEDGFELYCRAGDLETLWHALAGAGRAEPCGLGARDTLRLEAGYPLYGNDIDDTVTPLEAGLAWIVKFDKGADFTGLAALKRQKLEGVKRRLVGFKRAGEGGRGRAKTVEGGRGRYAHRNTHGVGSGSQGRADRHVRRRDPGVGRSPGLRRVGAQRRAGRARPHRRQAGALGGFGRGRRDPHDRRHR